VVDPKTELVVAELRRALEGLYGERFARMVLFGSHARGEAGPESDIDVLVVLRGRVDPAEEVIRVGGIKADLCLRHNVVISCVFMDEERFTTRHGPLLRNIRKEGIPV